ncbi:uncharacterized protein C20orf96 homolog isoform X1 [Scyliorhinus canicula]|uniref:uncharacterized protein C20orf96 homolog isoform X1 n=1 Tax=Scyliorhinus canicula TaxID=7830 RepID=UPI0018F41891|nr:uncharacterized protein C20orf96 homolog isoform X1 [Scyliorhinus canicula]XP_038659633.1 uncharacterized protein C20orf96 homolog isoform X1 [Scyliorhinus canicula]
MATMTESNTCIVKSLEKEFDMVDYSQWERTDRHGRSRSAQTSSLPPIKWSPEALGNHWTIVKKDREKSAHRATQQKSDGMFRPNTDQPSSSRCDHQWQKRMLIREDDPCYTELQKKLAILKYLITAKKKQMDECKEYSKNLLDMNMKLAKEMKDMDEVAMKESRNLLVQYSKFRKGISSVSEWKRQEIEAAKNDLKETEDIVGQKYGELHRQLEEVNTSIQNAQAEIDMLKEFRDKDFPVYSLRIAELQREIGKLPEEHQAELDDVEQIALAEKKKLEGALKEKEQEILQKIAEEQFRFIPPGLQELMFHNMMMKKEIEVHRELNKNMERNNLVLQQNLLQLLKAKRDSREEIFADILRKQPKCTPDMDVVLNIRREDCLPI